MDLQELKIDGAIEFLKPRYGLGDNKRDNFDLLLERFLYAHENIQKLITDEQFYRIHAIIASRYIVYLYAYEEKSDLRYDFQFYIKDLQTKNFNKVVYADIKVCPQKLTIDWIESEYEYKKKGFAGLLLKCIEKYCIEESVNKIYGKIHQHTIIGIDNLVQFYEKNGYEVFDNKGYFKKYIE